MIMCATVVGSVLVEVATIGVERVYKFTDVLALCSVAVAPIPASATVRAIIGVIGCDNSPCNISTYYYN